MTAPETKSTSLVMKLLGYAKKTIGSLLGGATGAGVTAILHAFGVDVDPAVAITIASVCAMVGTFLAPANNLTAKQIAKLGK